VEPKTKVPKKSSFGKTQDWIPKGKRNEKKLKNKKKK